MSNVPAEKVVRFLVLLLGLLFCLLLTFSIHSAFTCRGNCVELDENVSTPSLSPPFWTTLFFRRPRRLFSVSQTDVYKSYRLTEF